MADTDESNRKGNQASRPPLITRRAEGSGGGPTLASALALITLLALVSFWPTLRNGFLPLGFDDAIITDSPSIRGLAPANLGSMATELNHAHYVPLTMLSLALDYRIWGLDPFGYHLTNVMLHAFAAMLVCLFFWPLAPSRYSATLGALIFAVHPVQLEAVSVAIQRKTLLSGLLFFATLMLYRRWRAKERPWLYGATLVCFVAAGLSKPVVMSLPLFLLLYDYVFEGGRVRLLDKLPFFAVSAGVALVAYVAHESAGAVHPPHGGSLLTHVLMVSRVWFEYVAAVFAPFALSPIYYYPHGIVHSPLNYLALVAIPFVFLFVARRRQQHPWLFFCVAWFALALLPESNLTPLAQLRADRFLYLSMAGAGLGIAILIERLAGTLRAQPRDRLVAYATGAAVVTVLVITTRVSAEIWRSDVNAWIRVAQRHPWSATAAIMLARAHSSAGNPAEAEAILFESVRQHPQLAAPQLALARLYYERGKPDLAERRLQRVFELSPNDEQGRALLASLRQQQANQ